MSPSPTYTQYNYSKFTRGEKCLFIHLVVTFGVIILLIIIYFVHLCVVKHTRDDILKIYQRTQPYISLGVTESDYQYVGMIYLNVSTQMAICNTILLQRLWSLAPAQCTSMRSNPDMADYISDWMIKYKIEHEYIHSEIKRTITHSRFNRADYQNNIGLFEHTEPIVAEYYVAPHNLDLNDEIFGIYEKKMFVLKWEVDFSIKGDISDAVFSPVSPLPSSICSTYAAPVVETLRNYEFCVTFARAGLRNTLDHGAVLIMDSKAIGFFSWGDISGKGVPFVILNILHYKQWFENIISS